MPYFFVSLQGSQVGQSALCRPPSAGPASASLATSCRINCLTLITTLGKLDPAASAATVTRLLHSSRAGPIQPPAELLQQLIQSLCMLVASNGGDRHMKQAIAFLAAEEDGLLAHKRFQCDEVFLVVQQLALLAQAFLAQHGKKQPAGETSLRLEHGAASWNACTPLLVNTGYACGVMPLNQLPVHWESSHAHVSFHWPRYSMRVDTKMQL